MMDVCQKTSVDKWRLLLKYGSVAVILGIFTPLFGPALIAAIMLFDWKTIGDRSKQFSDREQAEICLLKTLEHYGLIRLLSNNRIELVQ